MNYNIPVAMESFETNAIKEASCGFNKLKNIRYNKYYDDGWREYLLYPTEQLQTWKNCDFTLYRNTRGIFDFPQLLLRCPAKDIKKFCVEWGFGGMRFVKYDWKLLLLINKLQRDVPYKEMITFAACLYKVLQKKKFFDLIAKTIVAYALLQHKNWKPYVWMLGCCHEFEEVIKICNVVHAVPLCLPFGKDRFSPEYHHMNFRINNLPDSLLTWPVIKLNCEDEDYKHYEDDVHVKPIEKWAQREQLISMFNLIDVQSFETVANRKNITMPLFANHVGYCLLVYFNSHTNIDQFCLKMLYKNTNIDAISGKLQPILGCNGWYAIMTDPKLTVNDIINLDEKLSEDIKYINFTIVDESSIVFLNSQSLDIIPPTEISIYWQYCNMISDSNGFCAPYFA